MSNKSMVHQCRPQDKHIVKNMCYHHTIRQTGLMWCETSNMKSYGRKAKGFESAQYGVKNQSYTINQITDNNMSSLHTKNNKSMHAIIYFTLIMIQWRNVYYEFFKQGKSTSEHHLALNVTNPQ